MAQVFVGADPVPWPGGFVASAASRARPGDDSSPPGGLRSTAQFKWPTYRPGVNVVGPCGTDLPSPDAHTTNEAFVVGPVRPVITVMTEVSGSTFSQLPAAEWETVILDQHKRSAASIVAYLAWAPEAQFTDDDGNVTANMFADAIVAAPIAGVPYPDSITVAISALRAIAANQPWAMSDLGMVHIPAGFGQLATAAGVLNDLAPGSLATIGPATVPLIEDPGYGVRTFPGVGELPPDAYGIVWTPTHSVRSSPATITWPESGGGHSTGGVQSWNSNDAAVQVSQQFVWDWPYQPYGVNVLPGIVGT